MKKTRAVRVNTLFKGHKLTIGLDLGMLVVLLRPG